MTGLGIGLTRALLILVVSVLVACSASPAVTLFPTAASAVTTHAPTPAATSTPVQVAASSTVEPAPTSTPTLAEPTPPPTTALLTHVVQPGETLFRIALKYGVAVDALRAANSIVGDTIYAGQVLIIPSSSGAAAVTTDVPGANPTARSTPPVSPPPVAASGLAVRSFTASPNPVDRGAQLTLSWDAPGATSVTIWPMTYDRKLGKWFRIPAGAQGYQYQSPTTSGQATGQWALQIPSHARYPLRFELEATDVSGAKVVAATDIINLKCYPSLTGAGYCPLPAQSVPGAYQPFEHGHLIWRGDTQQIFVLSANQTYWIPWSLQAAINSTNLLSLPPTGLYAPADRFAGLWSSLSLPAGIVGAATPEQRFLTVGEILGWATAPEQVYTMNMQTDLDNTQSGILSDHLFLSLPDGRVVSLILYDGADGTTGPGWSVLNP